MSAAKAHTSERPVNLLLMNEAVRIPEHCVHRTFSAETVVLDLDRGVYYGLNPTAGRMLEKLNDVGQVKKAAAELAAEFEQPLVRLQSDLCRLCQDLLDRGLLEFDQRAT
jgi:hypothetical protein